MNLVAITGTPGVGKSTIAKKLSLLLGYAYLNGSEFTKQASIGFDKQRKVPIVDPKKFTSAVLACQKKLAKEGCPGLVVESHLAHVLPPRSVLACIVVQCSLPVLARRLAKRGYSRAKIRENLDAEIFDTVLVEALETGHQVLRFDATRPAPAALKRLAGRIRKLVRTRSGL